MSKKDVFWLAFAVGAFVTWLIWVAPSMPLHLV